MKVEVLYDGPAAPEYKTPGAAGCDLYADEHQIVLAGKTTIISTGLRLAIPEGYEGQVRSRSGLATKGVFVLNSPGCIDSDYRGVVKVILHNVGSSTFTVNKGDRIAQLVITPIIRASFSHSRELPETARGAGGFGSTGTLTDLYLGLCVDYSSTSLHKVLNGRKINAKTHFDI